MTDELGPAFTLPAVYADPTAFVAFDSETWLIEAGNLAPPLVCASVADTHEGGQILGKTERDGHFAVDWLDYLTVILKRSADIIVGANIAFDVLVTCVAAGRRGVDLMPLWIAAYEADRVFDVQIAEALHAVARGHREVDPRTGKPLTNPDTGKKGRYSLATCVDLVLGRTDAKRDDEYRLRYGELDLLPIDQWPDKARSYPVDDARNTLEVALAQCGHLPSDRGIHEWIGDTCRRCGAEVSRGYGSTCVVACINLNLHDVAAQTRKALGLHLGSAWGLRTDPELVDVLLRLADATRGVGAERYVEIGLVRADGSEDQVVLSRLVAQAYGGTGTCEVCKGTGRQRTDRIGAKGKALKPTFRQCGACSYTGLDVATFGAVPLNPPSERTPNGSVKSGRDELAESGDETLMDYAVTLESDKISATGTYGKFLLSGTRVPINPRPNPVLDTARVSYDGAAQTLPRGVAAYLAERLKAERLAGRRAPYGVRDCVVARPGWLFDSEDYEGGELVTFAESALERVGWSDMGQALVSGINVHAFFAADLLGIPLAEFNKKDVRHGAFYQTVKPINFGCPGGIGAPKIVIQQRKQGPDTPVEGGPSRIWLDGSGWVDGYKGLRFCVAVGGAERCGLERVTEWRDRPLVPTCRRCIEIAEQLRDAWFSKFTEARPYLRWHANNSENVGWIEQVGTRRVRGAANYTAESNGDFQALLADVASRAQWRVTVEQYQRTRVVSSEHAAKPSVYEGLVSPLFGSRSILFAHDELFGESPESISHDVAIRKSEIMVEEFRRLCPNHAAACKAEPTLMRSWHKAAKPVWVNGRLVPWEPEAGS